MKSAKSAVKSRTVDVEAIQKFREKLEELEPKIKKIIVMENEEAAFRAAENQINRTQNKLDGTHQKRDWYQVIFLDLTSRAPRSFFFRRNTNVNWKRLKLCLIVILN